MNDNIKSVFNVNITDDKSKRKVMKAAASLQGIDSLSVNLEKKQLTVVGTVDLVKVVHKLRKKFSPRIETVGKDKKEGGTKQNKAESDIDQIIRDRIQAYERHCWGPWVHPYWHHPVEEGHSNCVIS